MKVAARQCAIHSNFTCAAGALDQELCNKANIHSEAANLFFMRAVVAAATRAGVSTAFVAAARSAGVAAAMAPAVGTATIATAATAAAFRKCRHSKCHRQEQTDCEFQGFLHALPMLCTRD
jgi:hypothetical protein